jgi:hypothetical protein
MGELSIAGLILVESIGSIREEGKGPSSDGITK